MEPNNTLPNNNDKQYVATQIFKLLNASATKNEEKKEELSPGEKVHQLSSKAAEAYNNGNFDDVKKCFEDILNILSQLPDNDDHKNARAFFLSQLAQIERKMNLNELAIDHLNDAIKICKQLPDTIENIYQKESYEDIRDEIIYEINKDQELNTNADDSILDALQNKSKNKKHITEKEIASNFLFTNEKPNTESESPDIKFKFIIILILISAIVILLTCC